MPDTNQSNAAVDTLIARVRGPAILEKLARDWNIHARTPAEASKLCELADSLHDAKQAESVKTASTGEQFLDRALRVVNRATGQPAVPDHLFKEAAAGIVSSDQEIANAALTYVDTLTQLEQQAAV